MPFYQTYFIRFLVIDLCVLEIFTKKHPEFIHRQSYIFRNIIGLNVGGTRNQKQFLLFCSCGIIETGICHIISVGFASCHHQQGLVDQELVEASNAIRSSRLLIV